jgi:four helix bundle protein
MTYDDWESSIPDVIKADLIWKAQAFRLASFLSACAEFDTRKIDDGRLVRMSAQLCGAAGSIPANIAEGYRRQSARDRVRYYEYALGSAQEAKIWYLSLRETVGPQTLDDRLATLLSITRLLLTMIRSARPPKPVGAIAP